MWPNVWRHKKYETGLIGIQQSIQKSMPKKYRKWMRKGARRMPKWRPKSMIFILFRKRRKRSRPFVFPYKSWFRAFKKRWNFDKDLCKIDARRSDAEMLKNDAKLSETGIQNQAKIRKNTRKVNQNRRPKIDAKNDCPAPSWPKGRQVGRAPLLKTNHLVSSRLRLVFVSSSSSKDFRRLSIVHFRLVFVSSLVSAVSYRLLCVLFSSHLCLLASFDVVLTSSVRHVFRPVQPQNVCKACWSLDR